MSNIKDVAAHAGVSFKTVARVINNEPLVRDRTREKVLRSIDVLKYRPNTSAKMMRNQKSGVYGVLMETNHSMAPAVSIIQEAQRYARTNNKLVITANVNKNDRALAIEQMLNLRVDGIIYATMYHQQVELPSELEGTPVVLANCFSADKAIPAIVPNEHQAAFELSQRLLNKGYQRIAFLNIHQDVIASSGRLSGYQDALAKHNIAFDHALLHYAEVESSKGVIQITDQILDTLFNASDPPDAIICGKDEIALDAYLYFAKKGIEVGKDIGIGSFDNMEIITKNMKPKLSTMELPHDKMGRLAMKYLLGSTLENNLHQVDWDFVEGHSF
ncbi:LacI family DNA-binding transcriptional regulator [Alginatibacterium sediminis]|uniref:LacI family DNA-binding transcriptional regulator n=1 Tax=Alginatibacterium sediminis TaxID=2164068 RepID=A0A420EB88_9ALTE|nr:LacI family DNA-binding transcriptional regulator [Alginatibacterium sediminis]RKF17959.1 LacI family DNA-binding transcriptional regulator [Alginatibacterium sediminis]